MEALCLSLWGLQAEVGVDADALAGALGEEADPDADADGDDECDAIEGLILRGGNPAGPDFVVIVVIILFV